MTRGIKLALMLCLVMAAIGFVLGNIHNEYPSRAIIYGLIGAFFGAIAAPQWEPKYFKYPTIWQISFSILGCLLFAFSMDAPFEGYVLATVVGAFLGFAAEYWIKHFNFP